MTLAAPVRAAWLATTMLLLAGCDRAQAPPSAEHRVAAPSAPAAPSASAALSPPLSPPLSAPPEIVLSGVVSFGATDPQSQALLAIAGAPAQTFHPGDAIASGWSLRSVADDHVVIAQGPATRRIDLSSSSPGTPLAAAPAASSRALPLDKPLPGFAPSAPPRMSATDGQASARNRAFLQGIEQRRAAGQQQQQRTP